MLIYKSIKNYEKLPVLFDISSNSSGIFNFFLCGEAATKPMSIKIGAFCIHSMTKLNSSNTTQGMNEKRKDVMPCKLMKITHPNVETHILLYDPPETFQYGFTTKDFVIPIPPKAPGFDFDLISFD